MGSADCDPSVTVQKPQSLHYTQPYLPALQDDRIHEMYEEPSPRYNHICTAVGPRSVLWGGQINDFDNEQTRKRLASVVDEFDHSKRSWCQQRLCRDAERPPGLRCGGFVTLGQNIYAFGGHDDSIGRKYNSLHELKTDSLEWCNLPAHNPRSHLPMPKGGCEMATFGDKVLGLFGGYGKPLDLPGACLQPESQFHPDNDVYKRGYTNEFHLYDLNKVPAVIWTAPSVRGDRPPPMSYFTMTSVDSKRAVLFGGNSRNGRMNDTYIVTLEDSMVSFQRLQKFDYWPEERSSHAACVLNYGQKYPQLLVVGGLDADNKTKGDMWLLSVDHGSWTEIKDYEQSLEQSLVRWRPTLSCVSLSERRRSVLLFGGVTQEGIKQAQTTILEFEYVEHTRGAWEWELQDISVLGSLRVKDGENMPTQEGSCGGVLHTP